MRQLPLSNISPYVAYAYAYPHKTAYRPLRPARSLRQVWAEEKPDARYLYLHVPFCEMRCGFCNLFTTANPKQDIADAYIDALWREARRVREAVGPAHYARMAVGGGTPTYLQPSQLDALFRIAGELFGVEAARVPVSVETSPRTADAERLGVLRDHGVSRISIGVQSLVEAEVNASGRAQKNEWVESAIARIRQYGFPTLNVDLIYGLAGQTVRSWLKSLELALTWTPEEFYLYPLYIRPLTGLQRWGQQTDDAIRVECYRAGRDLLLAHGYEQISMRMFSRTPAGADSRRADEPVYCCQDDGMVGLGCGARSYTRALHYSSDYAVGAAGVREIIADYIAKPAEAFDRIGYGCELNEPEQKRRWVIKSLLRSEGLALADYQRRFNADARADLPELIELEQQGLVVAKAGRLVPTAAGLERSDAIGPWLFSPAMRARMDAYEPR
ncbi:MAG TPA: STM4012 family radical SAM protein [Tepidisphaeraceae bacterium]|jgi:oxygen-independent coproporphyrinogen-3 oxidase|nr:STM4012 family radical SAM protein [Tepidisphaeraceae bacterium]